MVYAGVHRPGGCPAEIGFRTERGNRLLSGVQNRQNKNEIKNRFRYIAYEVIRKDRFFTRESRENPESRLYIFIGWMNIYIFYKIDHIVITILVDIFAPEALTKTELCDIILYIMALLSEAFIALAGCRFCKKKKTTCNLRVESPAKRKKKCFPRGV